MKNTTKPKNTEAKQRDGVAGFCSATFALLPTVPLLIFANVLPRSASWLIVILTVSVYTTSLLLNLVFYSYGKDEGREQ